MIAEGTAHYLKTNTKHLKLSQTWFTLQLVQLTNLVGSCTGTHQCHEHHTAVSRTLYISVTGTEPGRLALAIDSFGVVACSVSRL